MTATRTTSRTARQSFLFLLTATPTDTATRLVYADWCEEKGDIAEALHQRLIAGQETVPGAQCVTVARDGSDQAPSGAFAVPIYTSAIYTATRRADGLLTWRRTNSYSADRTAGRYVTGPMETRAKARAEARGCDYVDGVRHGHVCD